MFDKGTMAQLTELKTAIIASKEYGEGRVVGSNGRFGFVKLTDGRDAFLSPEKMQRVLPGDTVKVLITENDKKQLEATIESLIEPAFKRFIGICQAKGNNLFVQPDAKNFNRLIFIPPQFRNKTSEGDTVLCELIRHPYSEEGKSAARIIANLGTKDAPYFEHKFVIAKHNLHRYWPKEAMEQAAECKRSVTNLEQRADHTHIPFITIDSVSTRDMDDAVYAEPNGDGWTAYIAIADPSSFIPPSSAIARGARDYAQTVYLPGEVLPMLPDHLATDAFSLVENAERPAIICKVHIQADGTIGEFTFEKGKIRSRAKCNYLACSDFITTGTAFSGDTEVHNTVTTLQAMASVRRRYREANNFVHDDQPDYDLQLNNRGKIDQIHKRERTVAHKLIEEAMLIINLCAGEYLAQHNAGIHTTHEGLRKDRLGEIKALLKEELESVPDDIDTPEGFRNLMKMLKQHEKSHLVSPLKRMCANSQLNTQAEAHSNQGYAHYATVSSPLRRYADLSNHWSLSQLLSGKKAQSASEKAVEKLNETLNNGRQAVREVEQWLKAQYINASLKGHTAQGHIRVVTQQGFGVKLDDNGLEGFVQIPKGISKKFDAKRMTLTVDEITYTLDTPVEVIICEGYPEKRRVKFDVEAIKALADKKASEKKENNKAQNEKQ